MPGTSITEAISIFKTGQISFSASIDAYGFESSRFLGAVYSLHIEVRFSHPTSSRVVAVSFLDRMVEFRRCTEIFNFAHRMASNSNPSNSGAFGFPMYAVVLEYQTMT